MNITQSEVQLPQKELLLQASFLLDYHTTKFVHCPWLIHKDFQKEGKLLYHMKVHLAFPGGIFLKNFHTSAIVVAVVLLLLGPASMTIFAAWNVIKLSVVRVAIISAELTMIVSKNRYVSKR